MRHNNINIWDFMYGEEVKVEKSQTFEITEVELDKWLD